MPGSFLADASGQDLWILSVQSRRRALLSTMARESAGNLRDRVPVIRGHPDKLMDEVLRVTEGPTLFAPKRHPLLQLDINPRRLRKIVEAAHERHPDDYAALLGVSGVGPASVRSLALLAELIFNQPVSRRDPAEPGLSPDDKQVGARRWADYAYAHGDKDGTPFPVDRDTYDRNIAALTEAVRRARVGQNDKFHALRRLARWDDAHRKP